MFHSFERTFFELKNTRPLQTKAWKMKHAISSSCNHFVERIYGEGFQDPFTSQKQVGNGITTSLKPMRLWCPVDNNLMHPSTAPANERFVCLFVCYLFVWAGWSFGSYAADVDLLYPPTHIHTEDSHNTGNFIPNSSREARYFSGDYLPCRSAAW